MNMNFKELLEKATPGPWIARRHNVEDAGFVQAPEPTKPYGTEILGDDYFPHRSRAADVDYIARCNPQTMALVLEALEKAKRLTIETNENRDACVAAMTALDHLNSTP